MTICENFGTDFGTPKTKDEKRETLEREKPKIVDEKKYHGPAVTDFDAIRERMNRL